MEKENLLKVYDGLPPWARGVVVIGGIGILYIVGSTLYKKVQQAKNDKLEEEKTNKIQDELVKTKKEGMVASFSDVQFNNFADAAQNAFTNCRLPIIPCPTYLGVGCQSNSFREFYPIVKQLKNNVDFLQLQKTFGIRTITKSWTCGGDIRMNLPTLVKDQLNSQEIKTINNTLADNGITYRF